MERQVIDYRVKKINRFIVTRYENKEDLEAGTESSGSVTQKGEYSSADVAHEVAYALCRAEHEQLGWPIGDERIQYPRRDEDETATHVG